MITWHLACAPHPGSSTPGLRSEWRSEWRLPGWPSTLTCPPTVSHIHQIPTKPPFLQPHGNLVFLYRFPSFLLFYLLVIDSCLTSHLIFLSFHISPAQLWNSILLLTSNPMYQFFFFPSPLTSYFESCNSPGHFSDSGSSSTCLQQFSLMPTSVICLCLAGLDCQSEIPNPPIKLCAVWALRFKQTVTSEDIFKLMGFIYPLDFLVLSWFLWRPANPPARLQNHAAGRPHTSFKGIPRQTGAPWSHYVRISRNRSDRCSFPISKWGQL